MIAYHLDRCSRLYPGMKIGKIYTGNLLNLPYLSNWGAAILCPSTSPHSAVLDSSVFSSINTYNIEIQAEQIRKNSFPFQPSRLCSFYGVSSPEEFLSWKEVLGRVETARIFEVFYDGDAPRLDASFLNVQAANDPFHQESLPDIQKRFDRIQKSISCYWSGVFSDAPLPELLLPLPVTVLREVSLDAPPEH